jgi:hypothetical protein
MPDARSRQKVVERIGDFASTNLAGGGNGAPASAVPIGPLSGSSSGDDASSSLIDSVSQRIQLLGKAVSGARDEAEVTLSDPMKRWTIVYVLLALVCIAVAIFAFIKVWKRLNTRQTLSAYVMSSINGVVPHQPQKKRV